MACATVIEEMLPLIPAGMQHRIFDFGLHTHPDRLRSILQAAVDEAGSNFDTILLGYGLCSRALLGLRASSCRLVAPRVDDCIAIFLGSASEYRLQCNHEPGTYYLTKGWIEVGDTPFSDFDRLVSKYGRQRAGEIFNLMLGRYKRLALINTGHADLEKYRQYSRDMADKFGLQFEEIQGSTVLIRKLLYGPWDEDFVVVEPGGEFSMQAFMPMLAGEA
jgi:hypothetical protein